MLNSLGNVVCNCISGFTLINSNCVSNQGTTCGINQVPFTQSNGIVVCVCRSQFYLDTATNTCKSVPVCPANSAWNQ